MQYFGILLQIDHTRSRRVTVHGFLTHSQPPTANPDGGSERAYKKKTCPVFLRNVNIS